jgi:hypothetical protein
MPFALDPLEPLPLELPELGLVGTFTCTAMPVQAEGVVGGFRFYFRARHNSWRFAVADRDHPDPVQIREPEDGFLRRGTVEVGNPAADFMELENVAEIIRRCAAEYLSSQGGPGSRSDAPSCPT